MAATATWPAVRAPAAEPPRGYQRQTAVAAPTRLDWVFALANQSPATPPAEWLKDYDSDRQQYELFLPEKLNPQKPAPLVLFISPGDEPAGWAQWEQVCKQSGAVFASPFGAGNACPTPRRVRIVLDVLDDVRKRQAIDADRTYLAGFSGGARIACAVAFALPEYFGGVAACCGSENLRGESWLRERVADRLSVALITGEQDFNRAELERYRGPWLTDLGVRAKVWVVPKLGHAIPDGAPLAQVFAWLDEAASKRRQQARQRPAMHVAAGAPPTRTQAADALLKEAQQRLEKPATLYSGLMQMQGVAARWPDLPAAATARETLQEYDARPDRPWEMDDLAEQRRALAAEARATDRYASGPLPHQYTAERGPMAGRALELWRQVLADSPDSPAGKEARQRIAELESLIAKTKEK
jgi:hypothetical protein